MIGVTLITPSYAEIGLEAVKRFKRHTGLDVVILWRDDGPEAFAAKLEIPLTIKDQTVVFFDSDWWMIRDFDMSLFANSESFHTVHDPGIHDPMAFCRPDCEVLGIDPNLYFNSGFWVANFKVPAHRAAFAKSRQLMQDHMNGVLKGIQDFGEQSILNAGVQLAGCNLQMEDIRLNYFHALYRNGCIHGIPWGIYAVHAAAIPKSDKAHHLYLMSEMFKVWKEDSLCKM